MAQSDKRICIINTRDIEPQEEGGEVIKAGDRVMRTTKSLADKIIEGTKDENGVSGWAYTSKGKLKSFLNKNMKLTRNFNYIQRMMELTGENFPERRWLGNIMIEVPTIAIVHEKGATKSYKVPINKAGFRHINHSATERFDRKTGRWKPVKARKQVIDLSKGKPASETVTVHVKRSPLFTKNQRVTNTGKMRLVAAFAS